MDTWVNRLSKVDSLGYFACGFSGLRFVPIILDSREFFFLFSFVSVI